MKINTQIYCWILFVFFCQSSIAAELNYPVNCPSQLKIPSKEQATCGYFIVPENRKHDNGNRIKLFFIDVKSLDNPVEPDPIFYLIGGPGIAASSNINMLLTQSLLFRKNRNYIVIDQRGTGYSTPDLRCEINFFNSQKSLRSKLEICRKAFAKERIDISAYNTVENAHDIIDLANALEFNSWNILATSYGTRLALAIMQLHPNNLRAVILDSVSSLNPLNVADIAKKYKSNYSKFFNNCKSDPNCRSTYPDLEKHFLDVVNSLPKSQTSSDQITLTSEIVILQTGNTLLGSPEERKMTPKLIEQLSNEHLNGILNLKTFSHLYGISESKRDVGMNKVVTCYDDQAATSYDQQLIWINEANTDYPYFYVQSNETGKNSIDCQVLGYGDKLKELRTPLNSEVPVLILHGDYDFLPLYFSKDIQKQLKHAKIYTFDTQGHNVLGGSDCAKKLVVDFINDPRSWPINSC